MHLFSSELLRRYCITDVQCLSPEADLHQTIEALNRSLQLQQQQNTAAVAAGGAAAAGPTSGGSTQEAAINVLEMLKAQSDSGLLERLGEPAGSMMLSGISHARELNDPPGLHEKTEFLLREWVQMYHAPQAVKDNTKMFSDFVTTMHKYGILKTDEHITRFFRLCTEMCVDICYKALSDPQPSSMQVGTCTYMNDLKKTCTLLF